MERIEFRPGSSRYLGIYLILNFAGTAIVLMQLPVGLIFKAAGIFILIGYFWRTLHLQVQRISRTAVIRIWQDPRGRWGFQTRSGKAATGFLKGDSFKSPVLLILRVRFNSGVRNIVVPVDALNEEEYRILCARL